MNYLQRFGYEVEIYIQNELIPQDRLHGDFVYQKTTGNTTNLTFTILNKKGIQNPEFYQGKPVKVFITTERGEFCLFTGFVDVPSIDLIEEKTTFSCSDRRNSRIKNLTYGSATFRGIGTVGAYSTTLFGTPKDQLDELEKRLQTVPFDFDFDNNGDPQLTPWKPKVNADFILDDTPGLYSDNKVYYDKPTVSFSNPASRVNKVRVTLDHNYIRYHQQAVNVTWPGYENLKDWYTGVLGMLPKGTFPTKDTVWASAKDTSWLVMTPGITFAELWPAQGIEISTGVSTTGVVLWQPNKITEWTKPRTRQNGYMRDGSGNFVRDANNNAVPVIEEVKDTEGNIIMDVYRREVENTSIFLCRGASWTAVRKFTQNITENFEIVMTSPSELSLYDEVLAEENYSVTSDSNPDSWELNKDTAIITTNNVFYDQKPAIQEVNNALITSLMKAKTQLLAAHRDVRVNFNRSIWPEIDVIHTVELDIDPVKCIGRVGSITHNINFLTGEAVTNVELYLSRCNESGSDTPLQITPYIVDNPTYVGLPKSIQLGTHIGLDPALHKPQSDKWNGLIGNATIDGTAQTGAYRTEFAEQFIVDYPEISETLTTNRILKAFNEYTVSIPNDYLVIESNVYSE